MAVRVITKKQCFDSVRNTLKEKEIWLSCIAYREDAQAICDLNSLFIPITPFYLLSSVSSLSKMRLGEYN